MHKRLSKGKQGPEDVNEIAYRVYEKAIGEPPSEDVPETKTKLRLSLGDSAAKWAVKLAPQS